MTVEFDLTKHRYSTDIKTKHYLTREIFTWVTSVKSYQCFVKFKTSATNEELIENILYSFFFNWVKLKIQIEVLLI